MIATLIIDGVDLTPYIKPQMTYSWTAFDGENASRNLKGDMLRDFLTEKDKIEINLIPLRNENFWKFSDMLRGGKKHKVQYQATVTSELKTITCYCTSYQGTVYSNDEDGYLWTDTTFNLIEL